MVEGMVHIVLFGTEKQSVLDRFKKSAVNEKFVHDPKFGEGESSRSKSI